MGAKLALFLLVFQNALAETTPAGVGGAAPVSAPAPAGRQIVPAAGKECPGWLSEDGVPPCPTKETGILSENYPAMAHVVSDKPYRDTPEAGAFTRDFVVNTLKHSGKFVPLMFLPVEESTYNAVRTAVESAATSEEQKKQWLDSLVWVKEGPRMTWQQDYFESFNRPDGSAVLRPIRDYNYVSVESADKLIQAMGAKCAQLAQGQTLPPEGLPFSFGGHHGGGNVEALPGGLCLHGNNQDWDEYAKHYCGDRGNEVVIPTSWLRVGHADEIVTTMRKPGGKHPCDFSIGLASPKRALDLMRKNPKDPFFDIFAGGEKPDTAKVTEKRLGSGSLSAVCRAVSKYKKKKQPAEEPAKDKENHGALPSLRPWIARWFYREANAGLVRIVEALSDWEKNFKCDALTNADVLEALEDPESELGKTNLLIQRKMDETREIITKKLKERLPQCTPEFLDLPNLFSGGYLVEKPGVDAKAPLHERYELPDGFSLGLSPNPANAVQLPEGALVPHPQVKSFAADIKAQYKKSGLEVSYLDTMDYAHDGQGNAHCASHSIRYCRGEDK
jgi:hypothetical protein